ncbi:CDP-diacylglycerol--serine O-phosphatidyltransferase [Nioella nitratireducens]|uniref:CDP-diacylglycerol--serine O-phosphatidyltransferase n=1 Tax=Nioella nitratireducens TaxID=1287720 RepID=UPI0008FCE7F8|nr:CDP-diacylglycerol--serine O-phosphatidyltransferase [Nioella nitratireducens]
MPGTNDKPPAELAIFQLLPNMITIAAICAGLTAIRFGVHNNYALAVQLILAACIFDGIDGRLARLLNSDSKMGAELDSLADFLNFGVAPPLVLYFWALQDMRSTGWLTVLVFSVCCVVRLARFNVAAKDEVVPADPSFFTGVPAPAGAMLVLLPMFVSFAFANAPILPDSLLCLYIVGIGLLMISRIPIWSFKTTRISRDKVKFVLVGFAFFGAAVLTYAWITMVALCIGYIGIVIWALLSPGPATPTGKT